MIQNFMNWPILWVVILLGFNKNWMKDILKTWVSIHYGYLPSKNNRTAVGWNGFHQIGPFPVIMVIGRLNHGKLTQDLEKVKNFTAL